MQNWRFAPSFLPHFSADSTLKVYWQRPTSQPTVDWPISDAEQFSAATFKQAIVCRASPACCIGCRYCSTLGYVAGALIAEGKTSLMATASCLDRPCAEWTVGGYPLVDMMCIERRRGK